MSARDAAIAELVNVLGLSPGDAGAIVNRLTTAAALEAGARDAEALVEPLAVAVRKHADDMSELLSRAHRELLGEVLPRPE